MEKREKGALYEQKAAEYLDKKGYRILERNRNFRCGELDLIVFDEITRDLVFVEVRMRAADQEIKPEETLTLSKRRRLAAAMRRFLASSKIVVKPMGIRFDFIAFEGEALVHWKDFLSATDFL